MLVLLFSPPAADVLDMFADLCKAAGVVCLVYKPTHLAVWLIVGDCSFDLSQDLLLLSTEPRGSYWLLWILVEPPR